MLCRFCQTPLTNLFIDLGTNPPSNAYLNENDLSAPELWFPLKLYVCDHCFLVQIDEYQKAEAIFNDSYAYFSSFSSSWLNHCRSYTEMMIDRFALNSSSKVMEIASNDGYLLQFFKERGLPVLGIEPTRSTARAAMDKGIETIIDFFGMELAHRLVSEGYRADLILGNNVLAHVPHLNDFIKGLKAILDAEGIMTFEFPHLLNLVEENQFDTIYHEHFSYFSLTTVDTIFSAHGFRIFDVERIPTHGGSLRLFLCHSENFRYGSSSRVMDLLQLEDRKGFRSAVYYRSFASKIFRVKYDFLTFLLENVHQGRKICGYGAAAKGNTLLNYAGVKPDLLPFVADKSPHKQGKFLPGSRIPIVRPDTIRDFKPDYVLILPWNIQEEIMEELSYIREWGGGFVIAIPQLQLFANSDALRFQG